MRWFESGLNKGFMKGINRLIQAAKARRYCSTKKMKVIIHLIVKWMLHVSILVLVDVFLQC